MEAIILYSRLLDRTIYFLIILLLVLSPLPIGSVKPSSLLTIQMLSFIIFILWLFKSMTEGRKPFVSVKPYLALLLFLILCLFQTVPLPSSVLELLSGKSLEIWESTRSLLTNIGSASDMKLFTISVYPNATLKKTLLLLSYFVFGIVVSRSFRQARTLNLAIIPIFAVMAV